VKDLVAAGSKYTALDYFSALVQSAGRAGKPHLIEELLDDMMRLGIERPLSIYESAMRLLAGKKFFKEALSVYDRLNADGLEPSPISLSCLVSFAAELGDYKRSISFFERLSARSEPSIRACMTVLRVHAKHKDWEASIRILRDMWHRGAKVDSIVLNIVLDTIVSTGEMGAAVALIAELGASVADVVSHNIILKGFAQCGDVDKALVLLRTMPQRGVKPNIITFNTALDAAVRARRSDDVWRILEEMKEAGLAADKCTCSTLVKGLQDGATAKRLAATLDLMEDDNLIAKCSETLRASLFSGVLEAAVRLRAAGHAMRSFARMRELRLPIPPTTLRSLALTTAQAGDVDGCGVVWLYAANSALLQREKTIVDRLVAAGDKIDVATLQALKVVAKSTESTPSEVSIRKSKPLGK
jgi:pentatricopeptide repeat protein